MKPSLFLSSMARFQTSEQGCFSAVHGALPKPLPENKAYPAKGNVAEKDFQRGFRTNTEWIPLEVPKIMKIVPENTPGRVALGLFLYLNRIFIIKMPSFH